MISLIAAVAENNVIGLKNDLIWNISADLKHFATTTKGKPVIMGLNTFKSIFSRIGKPLPGRLNVVLLEKKDSTLPTECIQVTSIPQAFEAAGASNQEVFVIGGASVYKQTIDQADKLYITRIHAKPEGDVYFPVIDEKHWELTSSEAHQKDEKNEYDYTFTIYEKR